MAESPFKGYPQPIAIKDEPLSDIETEVLCKICSKPFASEMALRNHVKVFHIEVFVTGDPDQWTAYEDEPQAKRQKVKQEPDSPKPVAIKVNKSDTLLSMAPDILSTITAKNVSYIILKADNAEVITGDIDDDGDGKKDKKTKKKKAVVVRKVANEKREKLTQPITGPFECTEPSSQGPDGECHQMFFSCCEYSSHVRAEHSRRRKTLRCQVCERPLPTLGDGGFPCESCGEAFQSADDLQQHLKEVHVKVKKYECCICKKKFTQQAGVQQHMRMHTGDRPYHCTFCPKSFTQKSGLEQHLRTHTKIKPYKCVICSKTFCQSVHLKQHMRTHTNVAPFQCGICEKRFKQSSHLNYHLKNHNPANLTEEQREKYLNLVGKLNYGEEIDPEQVLAEQSIMEYVQEENVEENVQEESIQEDGSYDIDDSVVYVEVNDDEYVAFQS